MSLDGFTNAYRLERRTVKPTQLLLDPTNPRLITDSSEYHRYTPSQIASADLQAQVLARVCSKEHGVKQLIQSIKDMGFIGGLHEMIVRRIGSNGSFLVLEGNRRTAALRHLLESPDLRGDVLESIQEIDVQELIYIPNPTLSEDEVTDVILGTIHIDGPKEWGALERSHYIYRTYLRDLGKGVFRYDADVARQVGTRFKMSNQAVKRLVTISRIYEQMKSAGLQVEPKHYTLIDLAIKTRALAGEFFEIDEDDLTMSPVGVERFAELCFGSSPPVHNPKLFQGFTFIYSEGTELERTLAITGKRDIDSLRLGISDRKKQRAFAEDLDRVIDLIGSLCPSDFKGTVKEKDKIRRIQRLIETRLGPLAEE
jgi:hypothetical protein